MPHLLLFAQSRGIFSLSTSLKPSKDGAPAMANHPNALPRPNPILTIEYYAPPPCPHERVVPRPRWIKRLGEDGNDPNCFAAHATTTLRTFYAHFGST